MFLSRTSSVPNMQHDGDVWLSALRRLVRDQTVRHGEREKLGCQRRRVAAQGFARAVNGPRYRISAAGRAILNAQTEPSN